MAHKVYIPQAVAREGEDYLLEKGYEIVRGDGISREGLKKCIADCDAMLLRTARVDREVLEAGTHLKIVARHGAGYDNIDYKAAEELGIWVTYSPFTTGLSVAEFTVAAMLTLAKKLDVMGRELRAGNFDYKYTHKGMDLAGKTLGIIGLGKIGLQVARRAALGLDMNIIAYEARPEGKELPDYVKLTDLDTLLQTSDVVTIHVPGGPATKGMIGAEQFRRMKPSAYLINASRGGVMDEEAFAAAVRNGQIAGAAVDVFEQEPPRLDNPLFSLDNVLLTPHMASNTEECMTRIALDAATEIHLVLSGQAPRFPLNQPRM
ncbi:MAG: hydroxyacid dehydrogenase [Clostridium sp.]|nr:hydroxyacid dehydrogenase [Clostridium sp.]